ncbi:MAG: hypothetical protein ACYDFU_08725 [Nitrospirota bacterium]
MKKKIIMLFAGAVLIAAIPAFAAMNDNSYGNHTSMSGGNSGGGYNNMTGSMPESSNGFHRMAGY